MSHRLNSFKGGVIWGTTLGVLPGLLGVAFRVFWEAWGRP